MDSLYQQDTIILIKRHLIGSEFPYSAFKKIKGRRLYGLTGQKIPQLTVEEGQINGIERLEVMFSVFIKWRLVAVKEIIVNRQNL